jgi:hypothetical protein
MKQTMTRTNNGKNKQQQEQATAWNKQRQNTEILAAPE